MAERILAGVTADTFNYLQHGAGVVIRDFEYESIITATAFKTALDTAMTTPQNLGGTRGGMKLTVTPTTRKVDIDGTNLVSFVGDEIVSSWAVTLETSLVQFNPQALQEAYPSAEFIDVGTAKEITAMRIKQQYSKEDYATNHALIVSTSFGYLMVAFLNSLTRQSGDIQTTADGEAVIPIQITPKNADFTDIDNLPIEVWFVNMSDGGIDIGVVTGP